MTKSSHNAGGEISSVHDRLKAVMAPPRSKVLVAEDDPVSARILAKVLDGFGYETVLARDGVEAWEIFDREPVRLIISDWMMPGLDGLAFCEKVRARPKTPYIYFVLLTANRTTSENYEKATDAGVDDFLTKPLDPDAIRMRLRVAERILQFTAEIRQLQALIPMCAYCHKVRDEDDYWEQVETYLQKETGSRFSHGACPECFEKELVNLGASSPAPPGGLAS